MKTKLLKRLTKRFGWVYDHQNKDWVVTDMRNPLLLIKPLKDHSYAELITSMELGIRYVNHRKAFKDIFNIYGSLMKINKELKTQWVGINYL